MKVRAEVLGDSSRPAAGKHPRKEAGAPEPAPAHHEQVMGT